MERITKGMFCGADRHPPLKRSSRPAPAQLPAFPTPGQVVPPSGCSATALDKDLRGIRWRLDVVSGGTLKNGQKEVPLLVEVLRRTTEWLVWGDLHDGSLFDLFCEHSILAGFLTVLRVRRSPRAVKMQVLQTLSILVKNIQRATSVIYLLSGGLLNAFFECPPDLEDEEVLAYFITILKGVVLRLDEELAVLCLFAYPSGDGYGERPYSKQMPIFERSVHLIGHKDPMVHTAARTAVLCILRLNQPLVRAVAEEASLRLLVPCIVDIAESPRRATLYDEGEDHLLAFVCDIFKLDVPLINAALEDQGFSMDSSGCIIHSIVHSSPCEL